MTQKQSDINAELIEKLNAHAEIVEATLSTSTYRDIAPLHIHDSVFEDLNLSTWSIPVSYVFFERCSFKRVDFPRGAYGALFEGFSAVDCRMGKTIFDGSTFRNSQFLRCDLARVSMVGCIFEDIRLVECNLGRAHFMNNIWRNTLLEQCRFVNTVLVRPVEVSGLTVEDPAGDPNASVVIDDDGSSDAYRRAFAGFDLR